MDTYVLVSQSCPTLCDPGDSSRPGSSVPRILQVRILEWMASSFSRRSSPPGIKPRSLTLQADFLPFEPPGKALSIYFDLCRYKFANYLQYEIESVFI